MRIITAIELDAKMTVVVGEHATIDPTIAMTLISIARSLKRLADAADPQSEFYKAGVAALRKSATP